MPKSDLLTDDFEDGYISPSKWSTVGSPEALKREVKLKDDDALVSQASYDLSGSHFFAKVRVEDEEWPNVVLKAKFTTGEATFHLQGPELICSTKTADDVDSHRTSYDPFQHAYWRLRHGVDTIYFDTSPDGTAWTNFWQYEFDEDVSNAQFSITNLAITGTGFGFGSFGDGGFSGEVTGYGLDAYGTGTYGR